MHFKGYFSLNFPRHKINMEVQHLKYPLIKKFKVLFNF